MVPVTYQKGVCSQIVYILNSVVIDMKKTETTGVWVVNSEGVKKKYWKQKQSTEI